MKFIRILFVKTALYKRKRIKLCIIPFYIEIPDRKVWLPEFAIQYYQQFATQYISYLEQDESFVREPLSLEEIRAYGQENSKGQPSAQPFSRSLIRDVD